MDNKNLVKLTESDLKSIVNETVVRLLRENPENEGFWGTLGQLANKVATDVKDYTKSSWNVSKLRDSENNMKQAANNFLRYYDVYTKCGGTEDIFTILSKMTNGKLQMQPQQQAQPQTVQPKPRANRKKAQQTQNP